MTQPIRNTSQRLWYTKPATSWEEALPIGNGKMGGMVFGGIYEERIDLNEDTLWSGFVRDTNNYDSIRHLERVRELVFQKQYKAAEDIVERHMLGPWHECYLPLGHLGVDQHELNGTATEYERSLNLKTGIISTVFTHDGVSYEREVFMSAPDACMVLRFTSSRPKGISLSIRLESQLKHEVTFQSADASMLLLEGQCPSHVEPNYIEDHPNPVIYEEGRGLRFVTGIKLLTENGIIQSNEEDGTIEVQNADTVTLLLTAVTDFSEFHAEGYNHELNLRECVLERLERGRERTYEELKERHVADFEGLSTRFKLDLEQTALSELPTDIRLQAIQQGAVDPDFAALFVHYGRYLLISSSRPGSQPANLQGIWSREIRAPWGSNWTTNINIQMNYWHAETSNLAECHHSLFAWMKRLSNKGKRTALIHYGSRGWAAHHNVDIWMDTSPAGGQAVWAFWPMAGAWLCSHLWEHYLFNQDVDFLQMDAYPMMTEAARFYLDWLVIDPETGYLVTNPSTSPENKFLTPEGEPCAISKASTMDMMLIRELFANCLAAMQVLNYDYELGMELQSALSKMQPLQIGNDGRLQEWIEAYTEHEPGHRHLSHLYGMYPGSEIQYDRDPELTKAVRASLDYRLAHGGGRTGWSCAWGMALWARLREGEKAHINWLALVKGSTFLNLFDGHPYMVDTRIDYSRSIFQIDGNFGTSAAIVEMLIQSHAGEIHLLPALPAEWSEGSMRGLRARGGVTVDVEWQNGRVLEVHFISAHGGMYKIRSSSPLISEVNFKYSNETHGDYIYEIALPASSKVSLRALRECDMNIYKERG